MRGRPLTALPKDILWEAHHIGPSLASLFSLCLWLCCVFCPAAVGKRISTREICAEDERELDGGDRKLTERVLYVLLSRWRV
ncbi:hypothetical protein BKA61DRAFT_118887 [Leptodontidium sp. MPI-SDFR-AT-0119]|nr:hypothetical protein BKA61DRAFT_118887 [Leptodontidium sp. MPI-SDFR-AT-0119]